MTKSSKSEERPTTDDDPLTNASVISDLEDADLHDDTSSESPPSDVEVAGLNDQPDEALSDEPDAKGLLSRLDDLEAEVTTLKEAELRAFAELENFKRRKEQEKSEFIKFSNEKVIMDILPVFDAFDRALDQSEPSDDSGVSSLREGLLLIKKQMDSFLDKLHVTRIDAIDQEFDPNLHQAIKKEPKEGVESNRVLCEMQVGYRLNDRVIRPSMVVVSE